MIKMHFWSEKQVQSVLLHFSYSRFILYAIALAMVVLWIRLNGRVNTNRGESAWAAGKTCLRFLAAAAANQRHWENRLVTIEHEPACIRALYRSKSSYIEPVGLIHIRAVTG